MKRNSTLVVVALIFLCQSCSKSTQSTASKSTSQQSTIQASFISENLPLNRSEHFSICAEDGDTLFSRNGSILLFPSFSLLYSNGETVLGEVEIKFEEYFDVVDQFSSGIPMTYDSAGTQIHFESAGMINLRVYQDGEELLVNTENKPEMRLKSTSKDANYNLYYLDSVKGNWEYRGISERIDKSVRIEKTKALKKEIPRKKNSKAIYKPRKADNTKQRFAISVDDDAAKELQAYDNLEFELHPKDKSFSEKDFLQEWYDVKVKRSEKYKDSYLVTFSRPGQTKSYLTRAVLSEENYSRAIKEYHEQVAINEENERLAKIEEERRIKEIRAENKRIQARNDSIIRANEELRQLQIVEAQKADSLKLASGDYDAGYLNASLYRTFRMNQFGVWNCDRRILQSTSPVYFVYRDNNGNSLSPNNITVVYKNRRALVNQNSQLVRINRAEDCMIWTIINDEFYYADNGAIQASRNQGKSFSPLVLTKKEEAFKSRQEMRQFFDI